MPYTVQFVGLVCFLRVRDGRLALLPDGRTPEPGIDAHYGAIVVDPKSVQDAQGWEKVTGAGNGRFPLEGCEVVIQAADAPGPQDAAEHNLPQLRKSNPDFEIDPDRAQTVAKVHIRQGTLKSHLVPGGTALISQLDVPHDGPIEIRVKPDDGASERTITLTAGTEIAVTNMARGNLYREKGRREGNGHHSHFKIYEKLSAKPMPLKDPDPSEVPAATESESHHILFTRRGKISLYTNCSNTGCC
jgi:hypothetical protein